MSKSFITLVSDFTLGPCTATSNTCYRQSQQTKENDQTAKVSKKSMIIQFSFSLLPNVGVTKTWNRQRKGIGQHFKIVEY